MTDLDLSFLETTEIAPTEMARTMRGRTAEHNPMTVHYMRSYDGPRQLRNYRDSKGRTRQAWYGEPFQIKVKSEVAHHVERLLRRVAKETADGGVAVQFFLSEQSDERISIDELPETKPRKDPKTGEQIQVDKIKRGRNVWVAFQAKERIEKPRGATNDNAAEEIDEEVYEEDENNDAQQSDVA